MVNSKEIKPITLSVVETEGIRRLVGTQVGKQAASRIFS